MKKKIEFIFVKVGDFFYEKIFHEKMSEDVRKFTKNLSYVGIGTIIATIFSFMYNVLAGRLLGPTEFGKFSLINSVAMIICTPMLMGFKSAMLKYNSEKTESDRRTRIISTTYTIVIALTLISVSVYYAASDQISNMLSIPKDLFFVSIYLAILVAVYNLTSSTLNSLHEMKKYAILQPIYTITLLVAFLWAFFTGFSSYKSMVIASFLSYGLIVGLSLVIIGGYLRLKFDREWARKLVKYANYSIIGGVSSAVALNIDKIIINKYVTVTELGLYSAYTYSFTALLTMITGVFVVVFFPTASKYKNKETIFRRINRIVPYIVFLGLPIITVSGFLILKFYGPDYPFDIKMALLFWVSSTIACIYQLYVYLMNSIGLKGVKIASSATLALAVTNIVLNIILIPFLGIAGAVVSTICSYIVSIGIILSRKQYLMEKHEDG